MTAPPKPESASAAKVFPSPNHGERLRRPDCLVLHYTGMSDEGEALKWLCNPVSEVSAHYFVFENGHILQLVPEGRRAWHAGLGSWEGDEDINSRSIGVEIANKGHPSGLPPYPDVQIASVIGLCRDLCERWTIAPHHVLAHSDIAPRRKQDPGEHFPWERLHRAGIGHYIRPAPIRDGRFFSKGDRGEPIEALQCLFRLYGYGLGITGVFDDELEAVTMAFQRHFRPERVDGVADASTITTLRDLIGSRPGSVVA